MSESVGVAYVEVRPDARLWSERLKKDLGNQVVKVKAEAETEEANAKLDETARNRTSKIKVDVNKSQISEGAAKLGGFVDKLGVLPALAVAAGAALIPLAATIGGIAAALAAPLVIAGGGVGLFAVIAGLAVKQTTTQIKAVDTLKTKLAGLTKGTQAYADTQKQLAKAQAALSPAQKEFAASLTGLKGAFSSFLSGPAGQAVIGVVAQGMDLLSRSLPIVAPLLVAVSHTLGGLLGDLGKQVQGNGFAAFVHQLAHEVGPDIKAFAHIFGNFAVGLGGLFTALDRKSLSGGVLSGLEHLSRDFRDFGTSKQARKDLKGFFDYFHRVGPGVGQALGAVAHAIVQIGKALAPLGPVVFKSLEAAANALAAIPIPVLTALGGALVGVTAFNKLGGFKAVSLAAKGLSGLRSAGGFVGAASKLGATPVYVVNWEGAAGGVPGGGGGSVLSDTGNFVKNHPVVAGGIAATGLAAVAVGTVYLNAKAIQYESAPGKVQVGGMTPAQWRQYNAGLLNSKTGILGSQGEASLTSTTNKADALSAHIAAASRQIDMIGPHANGAFGIAARAVVHFGILLEELKDPILKVQLDDRDAIAQLERLRQPISTTLTVFQHSQLLDRSYGPGAGHGSPGTGTSTHSGRGAGTGVIHTHVNIDGKQVAHVMTPYMNDNWQANHEAQSQFNRMVNGQ